MIRLQQVGKRYADTGLDAISKIGFEMQAGEMAFLTGHSGAGKSTLLRLIAVIERPTRGRLWVAGHDLANLRRRQIPYFRRRLGIVFQDHHLLYDRSVYDNVALPLLIGGYRTQEVGKRVRAALDKVGLRGREQAYPIALSTGERQRVGIARAVVNAPSILLADEPTGNLDPALSREIMALFLRFNHIGTTVLIATHDIELVATMRRRVLCLRCGMLAADLPPARAPEILDR